MTVAGSKPWILGTPSRYANGSTTALAYQLRGPGFKSRARGMKEVKKNLFQVYSIESMRYYGEKKLTETKIPEPFAHIKDDFLQVRLFTCSWQYKEPFIYSFIHPFFTPSYCMT